jgi:AcrR family transcriptional regulator
MAIDIREAVEADNPTSKYVQLVETAYRLFWRHGIKRVSVEEICRSSQVSKMTFYRYFDNKTALALYVLQKVMQVGRQIYREIMDGDAPFSRKAASFIQMKMDGSDDVSPEIVQDLTNSPIPEVALYTQRVFQENVQMMQEDLRLAQEQGDIREDIKPEFLLYFINRMIGMATDEALTSLYASPQDLTRELLNLFFYGILSHSDREKAS